MMPGKLYTPHTETWVHDGSMFLRKPLGNGDIVIAVRPVTVKDFHPPFLNAFGFQPDRWFLVLHEEKLCMVEHVNFSLVIPKEEETR